ncbi:MAG: hypothetical protein IH607_06020 [Firmicutes bacterium]|nr:hypothetical protein [Bacillota bacterium]
MTRITKLILTAVLVLAVSVPLLAMATSETAPAPADGIVVQDTQVLPDGVLIGDDGYCYTLDENGVAQRLYARGMFGRYMALRFEDGAYCWNYDAETTQRTQTRNGGRGCPRWN